MMAKHGTKKKNQGVRESENYGCRYATPYFFRTYLIFFEDTERVETVHM